MSTTCRSEGQFREEAGSNPPGSRFPEDLRTWVKGPVLLRTAHTIAQEHTASALRPVFSLSAGRFHHPWRMLTLLTYAYASGIWHSRAIAEIAVLDPLLIELCHGHPPPAELIRRFRAHNGIPIVRCLEQLLRQIWCQRHESRPKELHPLLIAEILYEARVRLQRAERNDTDDRGPESAGAR